MVHNAFACRTFPLSPTETKGCSLDLAVPLRILMAKNQMLQRLPLAQAKASNTSEILLNEICQITEKVYNVMNSIQI